VRKHRVRREALVAELVAAREQERLALRPPIEWLEADWARVRSLVDGIAYSLS
jgi:hypothetical protein